MCTYVHTWTIQSYCLVFANKSAVLKFDYFIKLYCIFYQTVLIWDLAFSFRAAGTVAVKRVRPAVAATRPDTVAHFASTRTGRSTTTSVDRPCRPSSRGTRLPSAPPSRPTVGLGAPWTHHQQPLRGRPPRGPPPP